MKQHSIFGLALALVVVLWGGAARAQDLRVTAELSSGSVFVGDSARLTVTVHGSRSPDRPHLPQVAGLDIRYLTEQDSSSSYRLEINGRREERITTQYAFFYEVTPTRAGTFEIPAIALTAGGRELTTDPLTLTSSEPAEMENYKLRLWCEDTSLYAGQSADVTLTCYIGGNLASAEFRLGGGSAPFVISPGAPRPVSPNERAHELTIDGVPVVAVQGTGVLDGRTYTTLTMRLRVTPTASGELSLGPAICRFEVETRRRNQSPWDPPFGAIDTTRHVIPSNELVLDVSPLPSEGRPDDFTGLVGEFAISARADVTRVAVGDPINLSVLVTGETSGDGDLAPSLENVPGLGEDFRLSPEGWSRPSQQPAGARVYTTVVRVARDGVKQIPPIGFSYFDPETGSYRRAQSDPIALVVSPSVVVSSAEPIAPVTRRDAKKTVLTPGAPGLPANRSGPSLLRDSSPFSLTLGSALSSPVVMSVTLAPACACAALALVLAGRRRRDPKMVRLSAARRRALARAGAPGAALTGFVADTLGVDEAATTSADAPRIFPDPGSPVAAEFADVMSGLESAEYRGAPLTSVDIRRLVNGAARAIREGARLGVIALVAMASLMPVNKAVAQGDAPSAGDPPASVLAKADAYFVDALSEDDEQAARAKHLAAAVAYKGLIDAGIRSAGLYLNAGNAFFLAGDSAQAVLAYRRAHELAPTDKDIAFALENARKSLPVSTSTQRASSWRDWPLLWRPYVTSRTLIVLAGAFWVVAWGLVGVRVVRRGVPVLGVASASFTFAVALTGLVVYESYTLGSDSPAVITTETRALQGPGEGVYEAAFEQALPAGLEVEIAEERGAWARVRLDGSREGWVRLTDLERI